MTMDDKLLGIVEKMAENQNRLAGTQTKQTEAIKIMASTLGALLERVGELEMKR